MSMKILYLSPVQFQCCFIVFFSVYGINKSRNIQPDIRCNTEQYCQSQCNISPDVRCNISSSPAVPRYKQLAESGTRLLRQLVLGVEPDGGGATPPVHQRQPLQLV